jgi:thiol-disulfide isomerase/thioredoxin
MARTSPDAEAFGRRYRFDHPRMYPDVMNDMIMTSKDIGPGDMTPKFDLALTDGTRLTSTDLAAGNRPVLIIFGSRTCPVTESAAPGLKRLYAAYGNRIRFVMINVREAHPGGNVTQPKTDAQKLRRALDLKDHHQLPFEVAIDDLDGTFHRAFGARPNSAYVLAPSGKILFRAQWANETAAIDAALAEIASGKAPRKQSVTRTFHAIARMIGYISPVMRDAGKGARIDTWKVAPPLGMMMVLANLFPFLPRDKRGFPVMVLFTAIIAAAVVAATRL